MGSTTPSTTNPTESCGPRETVRPTYSRASWKQYFLLTESDRSEGRLVVIEHDVVRDWRRAGPTLTSEDASALKESLGSSLLPIFTIEAVTEENSSRFTPAFRADESDRVFRVVRHAGPLNADSHIVVMRPLDGGWYVRSMIMEWIALAVIYTLFAYT